MTQARCGSRTWFSQSASPANRNSIDEIMIWVGYRYNQPLSNSYNSAGQAVPYATNVSLGGNTYNVYLYNWPGGGYTMTYLNPARPGWFSGSLTPFFGYGEAHGWYPSSGYLNSVMAGWEFGHGSHTAYSWGVSGF